MGLVRVCVCVENGCDIESVRMVMEKKTNIIHVPAHKTVFPSQAPVSCFTKRVKKKTKKFSSIFRHFHIFIFFFHPLFTMIFLHDYSNLVEIKKTRNELKFSFFLWKKFP